MQLKSIVVTRPPGQDQELIDELKTSFSNICLTKGLQVPQVLSLPLLGILPKTDKQLPKAITSILQQADFAIFVSPNAIECVMRLFEIPKNKRKGSVISCRNLFVAICFHKHSFPQGSYSLRK